VIGAPPAVDRLAQLAELYAPIAELFDSGELPAGPPPTSLDTGATNRHWDERRATDRVQRNDRAKVTLADAIGVAVAGRRDHDPDGAAVLGGMAHALHGCRGARAYRDAGCGAWIARPRSCRIRLCPDCERARAARLVGRLAEIAGTMARPVFWTFTIPNVPADDLAGGVDVLLDAFRALRRRAMFRGGKCRPVGSPDHVHRPVAGGVYALEVTWNGERRDWHPHVHTLMDAPYILWSEARDAWRAVTCDAIRKRARPDGVKGRLPRCEHRADREGHPLDGCRGASIVWVAAVKGEPGSEERRKAVRETLKYTVGGFTKDDGQLADGATGIDLGDLLLALRNRRLVAGWGTLRHVHDDDEDDEDAGDVLRGPDVLPAHVGLPRICPVCRRVAMWDLPVDVPRRACIPQQGGHMVWRPPPAAAA
jgi:hypothetical protein